jgi:hypothetical protein
MTNAVLNEIERQKRAEQLAVWVKNENALAETLSTALQNEITIHGKSPAAITEAQSQPNPVEQALWETFMQWCNDRQVRHLPARPSTVSMFLYERGVPHETALDALRVIGRMHDKFQMPSPVACASVRAVLELSMDEPAPRSWKRDEQEQWAYLPAEIRFAISRRQRDVDKQIRRCQNETADLRKKVNAKTQEQIIRSIQDTPEPHRAATG